MSMTKNKIRIEDKIDSIKHLLEEVNFDKENGIDEIHRVTQDVMSNIIFSMRMDREFSFFALFLDKVDLKIDYQLPAPAACTFDRNHFVIAVNPFILFQFDKYMIRAVIIHECYHIIMNHLQRAIKYEKSNEYSHRMINIGLDVSINQYIDLLKENEEFCNFKSISNNYRIPYHLIEEGRECEYYIELIKKFMPKQEMPPLPFSSNEDSDDESDDNQKNKNNSSGNSQSDNDEEENEQNSGSSGNEDSDDDSNNNQSDKGNDDSSNDNSSSDNGDEEDDSNDSQSDKKDKDSSSEDDNNQSDSNQNNSNNKGKGKRVVKHPSQGAEHQWGIDNKRTIDGKEISQIEDHVLKELLKNTENRLKNRGTIPAGIKNILDKLKEEPIIRWQDVLKQYVGRIPIPFKKTTARLSRRMPYRLDILGKLPDAFYKIVVAIDTSGSMSDEDIQMCFNEVWSIISLQKKRFDITVIECDAEINKVYHVKRKRDFEKIEVHGRGGTEFSPVFKYLRENKHQYKDCVTIYFTDGYGEHELTVKPINYNNIWVLTEKANDLSLNNCYGRKLELRLDDLRKKYKRTK